MTNCGALGWTTDVRGYCYAVRDPLTDTACAAYRLPVSGGNRGRVCELPAGRRLPDRNRYAPGANCRCIRIKTSRICARLSSHFVAGVPAVFQFGGLRRSDRSADLTRNSDIVVWAAGPAVLSWYPASRLSSHDR